MKYPASKFKAYMADANRAQCPRDRAYIYHDCYKDMSAFYEMQISQLEQIVVSLKGGDAILAELMRIKLLLEEIKDKK